MNRVEVSWWIGWRTVSPVTAFGTRLRVYGAERVPSEGGCVLACNHFHWIDPPILGTASPRIVTFMAKVEAHRVPGLGSVLRAFGCFPVRRGESDRDAVRLMRGAVAAGGALGLFVEGTRQLSGEPGVVQPGAAMVALLEGVPIIPAAIHGTETWRPGSRTPVSLVFGEPMRFEGLPKGGRGYKEASALVEAEIRRLWEWLVEHHRAGRPADAPLP